MVGLLSQAESRDDNSINHLFLLKSDDYAIEGGELQVTSLLYANGECYNFTHH